MPNTLHCPSCGSQRIWRDGLRYHRNSQTVQRYICRSCGYRFSEKKDLNTLPSRDLEHRVSVSDYEMKNLVKVERKSAKTLAGLSTRKTPLQDIKGKIVEFAWWLTKNGYRESTIRVRSRYMRSLVKLGADLFNAESVKETIAKQASWSENFKATITSAYACFAKFVKIAFEKPRYQITQKLPFIPLESEIDQLIAGCGKKVATFLQLLKETAMRSGEAKKLEWTDIDTKNLVVRVNSPEKRGNPRILKISSKVASMLNNLPKSSSRVYGDGTLISLRNNFVIQRKRIAHKLSNPRILRITFHTLRHWKATTEYHKTKDILHVKRMLGHKSINSTILYTQLIDFQSDEFSVRVAKTLKEACDLVEAGFEYVTDMDSKKIFRKRR